MIKAIETSYKNYRFRSRTEARWAVWLDAMGLEWDYEQEGFDLGSAGYYLPDFVVRIPVMGIDEEFGWRCRVDDREFFLEIKPGNNFYFDKKHAALSKESGKDVVCAFGLPSVVREAGRYEEKYGLYVYHDGELIYPGIYNNNNNPESGYLFGIGEDDDLQITYGSAKYSLILAHDSYGEWPDINHDLLKYAYQQAMSVRFEHGEQP